MNMNEIIVDNFAGGGGASTGIEMALGRPVTIAINHDPEALAMHKANHPDTLHYCENVLEIDPETICAGRKVALAWFSPDCKHFSRAKGSRPVDKNIRGLAWVALKWAQKVKPRIIALENVEEFMTWGPLVDDKPCPARRGATFHAFVRALERQGYIVDWRMLRACDYGAPTIRRRLFLVARRDGQPIVWPAPTHGAGLISYRPAADCIDWSIPCPSIYERKKPLAENTLKRIARGIQRYVIDTKEPFILNLTHGGRLESIQQPFNTITGANRGEKALLVAAFMKRQFGQSTGHSLTEPNGTITANGAGKSTLVASHLPMPTVQAGGKHLAEVRSFLIKYYSSGSGKTGWPLDRPMPTVPTVDRLGLVTIHGHDYQIVDIGMRMLTPRELFRAQGFPDSYVIDPDYNGKTLSKTAQIRMCGNSVPPQLAEAIVKSNYSTAEESTRA